MNTVDYHSKFIHSFSDIVITQAQKDLQFIEKNSTSLYRIDQSIQFINRY